MKISRWDVVIVLVLLVLAGIPRLVDLGLFLTADEKNWIGRSYEFVRAFKDWRFNDMLQTTHPGVTTLWLAGAAVTAKILLAHVPFSFQNLIYFVTAAQFSIALVNVLVVPVIYLLLRQLFTKQVLLPALAGAIIALDPFLVGYSRVVHVDALLAGFLFMAVLTIILYVQKGYARRWLIASALLSGLAVLTKAPAVFIIPFFGLAVLVREGRGFLTRSVLLERSRDFVLWLLIIGLMIVLLWPAMMWVPNPEGNVLVLKRDLSRAAITPHNMTQAYTLDASYYLFTLITRTNPAVLILAILALVAWLVKFPISNFQFPNRKTVGLLVAYVFFFVLMMTIGAKKGDRYILPVWPALDVLAAIGVVVLSQWFGAARKKAMTVLLSVLVVGYLGAIVYHYHPYAIAYSNPLFPDNLSQELGWGEWLEQVGAWLNEHDPNAVVASWYPEELGAYTSARVAHINAHEQPRVHYVVLYRNMFGRAPDHPANDFIDEYYKKRKPVFIAYILGKEFAWVFEKQTFERVVGELVRGVRAGQDLEVPDKKIVGLEVMVATYSGRATDGELVVDLKKSLGGPMIYQWRVPVAKLEDNQWLSLDVPKNLKLGRKVFVEIGRASCRERV